MCSTFEKQSGQSVRARVALRWDAKQLQNLTANGEVNDDRNSSIDVHNVLEFIPRLKVHEYIHKTWYETRTSIQPPNLPLCWEIIHVGLAILDPLFLDQLLPLKVVQPVHQLDRPLADTRYRTDISYRLGFAQQQTRKVNRTACDRHRTPPICDAMLTRGDDDIRANGLHADRQIEMITVPDQQRLRSRRRITRIVALGSRPRGEIERLFECLVALPKCLLRHVRQIANLSKRPGNVRLATRYKDACSNDSL